MGTARWHFRSPGGGQFVLSFAEIPQWFLKEASCHLAQRVKLSFHKYCSSREFSSERMLDMAPASLQCTCLFNERMYTESLRFPACKTQPSCQQKRAGLGFPDGVSEMPATCSVLVCHRPHRASRDMGPASWNPNGRCKGAYIELVLHRWKEGATQDANV